MRAPLSWLKEYVDLPLDLQPEAIAQAFIKVGFEVEEVISLGSDITGPLVVGRVQAIEELSGHKKPIRYVTLDCDEGRDRFVICGATNFKVGDLVVVAMPGAVLPGNFAISSRETYGKVSDGMICSARELGMGEDHSGIIVLDSSQAAIGEDALALLQLTDTVFDIAVNPDRGYALSIRGLARELAGSLDLSFTDPTLTAINLPDRDSAPIAPRIEDGASQIYLRSLSDVKVDTPTPLWMRRRIEKCGMRSISLPVDITNYLMLELGQPLHAFDTAEISNSLRVRNAKSGESLKTLDGAVRELHESDLVIADGMKVLALAGTMGGEQGEVGVATTGISIEAAHFSSERIAKNARTHRLSTEASRRFERFVDPQLPSFASAKAAELLISLAGAKYLGSADDGSIEEAVVVDVDLDAINRLLGREYSISEMESALRRIGATWSVEGRVFHVVRPSWRPDLSGNADFAEEIARIHGYNLIPLRLPVAKIKAASEIKDFSGKIRRRRLIADFLAARGLSETQNYPFTSQDFIDSLGFEGARARAFKLANPLSEEFPLLRTHLLQSLLPTAVRNHNRVNGHLALFEIGSVFRAPESLSQTPMFATGIRPDQKSIDELFLAVPHQPLMVAGVMAGELDRSGWWGEGRPASWSDAISLAGEIISLLGSEFEVRASDFAPWHPGRCAELRVGGVAVAHAGELHPRVVELLGLPKRAVAFALIVDAVPIAERVSPGRLATMPPAIQDVALVVDSEVPAAEVERALVRGAGEMLESIELFDRYEKFAPGKVSLAFTLTFRSAERTLNAEEIAEIRNRAVEEAKRSVGAELRG